MTKSLEASEVFELIKKQWATTKDIQQLGCCGINKAQKIKNEIRNKMVDKGLAFPRYMVSMEYVIDYFNINEERINRLAKGGETYE